MGNGRFSTLIDYVTSATKKQRPGQKSIKIQKSECQPLNLLNFFSKHIFLSYSVLLLNLTLSIIQNSFCYCLNATINSKNTYLHFDWWESQLWNLWTANIENHQMNILNRTLKSLCRADKMISVHYSMIFYNRVILLPMWTTKLIKKYLNNIYLFSSFDSDM